MNIAQTMEKITDLLDGLTSAERDNVCEWLAEKYPAIAEIIKQKYLISRNPWNHNVPVLGWEVEK